MTREVSLSPSRPANGDLLTAKDMLTVGSSTSKEGKGSGFAFSTTVSPIWMSAAPLNITISPAVASVTDFLPKLSYTNKSLILMGRILSSGPFMAPKVAASPALILPCLTRPIPSLPLNSSYSMLATRSCVEASASTIGAGMLPIMASRMGAMLSCILSGSVPLWPLIALQ